jgi:ABC transporter, ATP-binding family protein
MEEPIVRVEHLSHRYSVQWVIRDINFEINQKGILGLLGSNGAGKSTTMNIICGVLNQTEGTVYINGIDTRKQPVEAKKYIGFLPQKPPLYTDHNVSEYLTYCAHLRLMDDREVKAAVESAMKRCGIAHFSKRLVKNLSGGYQQRLGIAQAIVHNPKLVVLDEPTNGLDPNQILEIRDLIREIAQDHAVLLSTHILSEVEAICQNIKMIEHGNLIFSGTLDEFHDSVKSNTCIVKLENAPAEGELGNIPGVIKVKKLDEHSFRLQLEQEGEEVAKRVAEICVNRGWRLSEMQMEKVSMDEIFAQLSGKRVVDKF